MFIWVLFAVTMSNVKYWCKSRGASENLKNQQQFLCLLRLSIHVKKSIPWDCPFKLRQFYLYLLAVSSMHMCTVLSLFTSYELYILTRICNCFRAHHWQNLHSPWTPHCKCQSALELGTIQLGIHKFLITSWFNCGGCLSSPCIQTNMYAVIN